MCNKLARPTFLRFRLLWWLIMPGVACITWRDNFKVFLPLVSSNFVTSKTRKESLFSNQLTTINMFCYLYHVRIKTGRNLQFTEYSLRTVFAKRLSRDPYKLLYQQCFNLLTCVQYLQSAWFLDGRTSIFVLFSLSYSKYSMHIFCNII